MKATKSNENLLFIEKNTNLEDIKKLTSIISDIKIISFDYDSHKLLIKHKIPHQISDMYISENEIDLIQEKSYKFSEWYNLTEIKELQTYKKIDLGSLYKIEFFVFILPFLKKLIEIKNIHTLYPHATLFTTNLLSDITKFFYTNVRLIDKKEKYQKHFFYDDILLENNFFRIKINYKTYKKLRNYLNQLLQILFKSKKIADVLLVEFNTILYKDVFFKFSKHSLISFFYGMRRPPVWNLQSFSIFSQSDCKIMPSIINKTNLNNYDEILQLTHNNFNLILLNHNQLLESFFQINNFSFWEILKPYFKSIFRKHMEESVEYIEATIQILELKKPKSILLLSESGKTEQIILKLAKFFSIPCILLQHGLGHDNKKGHNYNIFTGSVVKEADHFLIWGDAKYRYAQEYDLPLKKITKIGSVVHDQSFKFLEKKSEIQDYILVIAQGPLNMHVRDYTVTANNDYENIIRHICSIAKKNNKKMIIKLHPYEDDNGEPDIAREFGPNIHVIKKGDVLPLINSCKFVISISTSMSNVILDGHILQKPVIRIPFGEWMGPPDQLRSSSCHNITLEEFENILQKLFSDPHFSSSLIANGKKFLDNCLVNQGLASDKLSEFIKSISKSD